MGSPRRPPPPPRPRRAPTPPPRSAPPPPSFKPVEPRAGVGVLLQDLGRAVASERVSNLQVLMPGMAVKDVTAWEPFFQRYTRLTARYAVERLSARGDTANAVLRTSYTF